MASTVSRLSALLATALVVAGIAAPSALAKAEEIAYRCDLDVCLADPSAPNSIVNLTNNGAKSYDEHPVWSPDGRRVAFVGSDPGKEGDRTQNIWVMEPGKGEPSNIATQLTPYTGNVTGNDIDQIAWSPDGSAVAYSRTANYGNIPGVFLVAADGTTKTPVTVAADGTDPTWSPDGNKIAYSARSEQIYVVNPNGSNPSPLPDGKGTQTTWSPDGSQIAFGHVAYVSTFRDLHILPAPGCSPSPVIVKIPYNEGGVFEQTQWADPAWSAAGDRLSYRATAQDLGFERVVGRLGSPNVPLQKVMDTNMGGGHPATWSPDGKKLAYEGYAYKVPEERIFVSKSDGSGSAETITPGPKDREADWRFDPLVSPQVPLLCTQAAPPSNGGDPNAPTAVETGAQGQQPPRRVWFTKVQPIVASGPVHVMIVACGAPDCGANSTGYAKASRAAGLPFRPALFRKKPSKKVIVGRGGLKLKQGEEKTLDMYLNKPGRKLLEKQGKLDIQATVTITGAGQPSVTEKRTVHVVLKKSKKKKKH